MEEEEEVVEVEAEVVVERARKQSIRQLLPPLKTPPSKPFQRFFFAIQDIWHRDGQDEQRDDLKREQRHFFFSFESIVNVFCRRVTKKITIFFFFFFFFIFSFFPKLNGLASGPGARPARSGSVQRQQTEPMDLSDCRSSVVLGG